MAKSIQVGREVRREPYEPAIKTRVVLVGVVVAGLLSVGSAMVFGQRGGAAVLYNTVKARLETGEQVVGATVMSSDPDIYCAMANSGFDFLEMQAE